MITNFFLNHSCIVQALCAGTFTFFFTVLGAAVVLFFKKVSKNMLDSFMAISSGVMLAAAIFSLLLPSIDIADSLHMKSYVISSIGFFMGAILIILFDIIYNFCSKNKRDACKRSNMILFSITIHNIPEGLILGVSFGSVLYNIDGANIMSSLLLTLGIALQNFPEGCAISLPLVREGNSRFKSFILGSLSAIVEPIFAVVGTVLVLKVKMLLPILLSFASGAMIYVVISELIPEYSKNKKKILMNLCTFLGFIVMMILDISLG